MRQFFGNDKYSAESSPEIPFLMENGSKRKKQNSCCFIELVFGVPQYLALLT
jgi:hypothetical protein